MSLIPQIIIAVSWGVGMTFFALAYFWIEKDFPCKGLEPDEGESE